MASLFKQIYANTAYKHYQEQVLLSEYKTYVVESLARVQIDFLTLS